MTPNQQDVGLQRQEVALLGPPDVMVVHELLAASRPGASPRVLAAVLKGEREPHGRPGRTSVLASRGEPGASPLSDGDALVLAAHEVRDPGSLQCALGPGQHSPRPRDPSWQVRPGMS